MKSSHWNPPRLLSSIAIGALAVAVWTALDYGFFHLDTANLAARVSIQFAILVPFFYFAPIVLKSLSRSRDDEEMAMLMEASQDAFWIADVDPETLRRQIYFVSPVFEKIWGRSIEELKEKSCVYNEWVYSEDYDWVGESLVSFLKGESECDIEFRICRSDGSIRWVWTKAQRVLDSEGKVSKVVGITRDITEKKETEISLRISERRYRNLFDHTQDAIVTCDLEGCITSCNSTFEELIGYTSDELVGKRCNEITPAKWIPSEMEIIDNQVLKRGYSDIYEKELRRKDGEIVVVHVRTTLLKSDEGEPIGFYRATKDVTGQKRQEKRLIQARKQAEEANAAKDRFLAMVSHELRTPLNPIIGYAEILSSRLRDPLEQKFLRTIKESAKSMARLITDVLNYAMIESGKMELLKNPFRLSTLLRQAEQQVERAASERGNHLFVTNCWKDCLILGDEQLIRQILSNLLVNACKFTKKGTVRLTTELVEKHIDSVVLGFEVEDTGVGIPKEEVDRVFQPFEQVGSVNKAETSGVGLGLAICKQLVDAMDGEISVSSRVGVGTTFRVELPLELVEEGDVSPSDTSSGKVTALRKSYKTLVVEDDDDNLSLIRDYLMELGCTVNTASNGRESLSLLDDDEYDIVFMDLSMPEMNGFQATNHLRTSESRNRNIPVVGISAHVSSKVRSECMDNGMNDFLEKPISPDLFESVIRKWLE